MLHLTHFFVCPQPCSLRPRTKTSGKPWSGGSQVPGSSKCEHGHWNLSGPQWCQQSSQWFLSYGDGSQPMSVQKKPLFSCSPLCWAEPTSAMDRRANCRRIDGEVGAPPVVRRSFVFLRWGAWHWPTDESGVWSKIVAPSGDSDTGHGDFPEGGPTSSPSTGWILHLWNVQPWLDLVDHHYPH